MLQTAKQPMGATVQTQFRLYKIVTVGIMLVGAGLDLVLLLVGPGPLLTYVFTPVGEMILTTWMATALVLGLIVYPHLAMPRRATRIAQRVLLVYLGMLVLMHGVNNLLLGNTAGYLATFSAPAYPYVAAVVLFAAALFTAGLRLKSGLD